MCGDSGLIQEDQLYNVPVFTGVMCISVICNKQGHCWPNGCPKQDSIGLDLNRIF